MFGKLPNRRRTPDCLLCAGFVVTSKGKQCLQIVLGFKQVKIGLMSAALEIACDFRTDLTPPKKVCGGVYLTASPPGELIVTRNGHEPAEV